jgi:hypothetical protein
MIKSKKAQLGPIEAKFFIIGLLLGLVIGFVVIYLASKGIIPFGGGLVC